MHDFPATHTPDTGRFSSSLQGILDVSVVAEKMWDILQRAPILHDPLRRYGHFTWASAGALLMQPVGIILGWSSAIPLPFFRS
jgi:hypothetical protein